MHIIILCIGNGLNPDKTLFWNKGKSMLCGYLILRGGHIDNVGSKRSWKVFVQSRNCGTKFIHYKFCNEF